VTFNRGGFGGRNGGFQKAGNFQKPGFKQQQQQERQAPTCNEYQGEAGCGAEIKLLKDSQTGRYEACSLIKYPTFDNDGNCEFRYVPHWLECTAEKGARKREQFLSSQLERLAGIRAKSAATGAGSGHGPGRGAPSPRGGGLPKGPAARGAPAARGQFSGGRPAEHSEDMGGENEEVSGAED
jgi:hypothetical protein